jgi:O-acetyl-ADP-ribose deacetylase (regulator of RNase III)
MDINHKLHYVLGDGTLPTMKFHTSIAHVVLIQVCNNVGGYGAGFSGALAKRFPKVEEEYRKMPTYRTQNDLEPHMSLKRLGTIGLVPNPSGTNTTDNLTVINMIAQDGYKSPTNPQPLSYISLVRCLRRVQGYCDELAEHYSAFPGHSEVIVQCPRIGAGLGGGDWKIIEHDLITYLVDPGYDVFVYDLEKQPNTVYDNAY